MITLSINIVNTFRNKNIKKCVLLLLLVTKRYILIY
nr:MAG TPA: hypothetical protein [Caudoviricetes sp.]DAM15941.1 MAG TPA: hypothetical protein [Caudoviricetes sp.]